MSFRLGFALTVALLTTVQAAAETWNQSTGSFFFGDAPNWLEGTVPNAVGATATFPSPTGTRRADLNNNAGNQVCPGGICNFTVGTLNFVNDTNSTTTIGN